MSGFEVGLETRSLKGSELPSQSVRLRYLAWLCVLGAGLSTMSAHAQTTSPLAEGGSALPADGGAPLRADGGPALPAESSMLEAAAQIGRLMQGKLDPSVDPRSLFDVSLSPGPSPNLRSVLERLNQDEKSKQPNRELTPQQRLVEAQAAFLSLPAKKRRQLLTAHQARRQAADRANRLQSEKRARLAELETSAANLEAFLEGRLSADVDPSSLLSVNLLDDASLATSEARRRTFLEHSAHGTPAEPPPGDHRSKPKGLSLDAQLALAAEKLDSLRARFSALDDSQQKALFVQHEEAKAATVEVGPTLSIPEPAVASQKADEAAAAKELALQTSKDAGSEVARLIAEKKAELLAVQEAQARFEASLATRQTDMEQDQELALRWGREVRDLMEAPPPEEGGETTADPMYGQLVTDLESMRSKLRQTLSALLGGGSAIPSVDKSKSTELPGGVDDRELKALVAKLQDNRSRLETLDTRMLWDTARTQRDAMVAMNRSRLRLMSKLSLTKRSALRGFGPEGRAQVRRELAQMTLEARYRLLALPRLLKSQFAAASKSSVSIGFVLFKLLLLILLFQWWRRNGDSILDDWRRSWRLRRPQTDFTRRMATTIWYLKRVRKPLAWLVLVIVLQRVFRVLKDLPELEYLWILALWVLLGSFVIHFVNAVAERQGRGSEASAKLRFRSLRLVGVTIVAVGLILSLTNETVGQGAIYAWVTRGSWVLLVPILLTLVVWWRPIIFERAAAHGSPGRVLKWVSARNEGPGSYFSAGVGGIYLLGEGLNRFSLRQASQLAPTRRVLSYFFRRKVEKQTSLTPNASKYTAVAPELYDALGPDHPSDVRIEAVMRDKTREIRNLVREDNNRVIAVTGLRGMGKTTFMKHVVEGLSEQGCWQIQCRAGGIQSLLADLAQAAGLPPTATEEEVSAAIGEKKPTVICIDDVQRIIRPVIGGQIDLDRFIDLAHQASSTTSWLVAVGLPAWQYLQRAEGERAIFDEVVELEPWSEEDITSLIRLRNKAQSIQPSFKGLNVPRQVDTDARMNEEERAEHDFYRVLWDNSEGIPGLALQYWRESLSTGTQEDRPRVRLYKAPTAGDLDQLQESMHFVLRAIVQLDLATEHDIAKATNLRPQEVSDALRLAKLRGYIEITDEGIRAEFVWYRAILQLLRRHHLVTI